jgi:clan AA aspartic protease
LVTGTVNEHHEALIRFAVRGPRGRTREIEAVVDTGFSGSLTLPLALIRDLDLPYRRRGKASLGDGSIITFDVFEATVEWNGRSFTVPVDRADTEPLLGVTLLSGHELTIQVIEGGAVSIRPLQIS